jgi:DNA-binding NarL/FixJ family response regulator
MAYELGEPRSNGSVVDLVVATSDAGLRRKIADAISHAFRAAIVHEARDTRDLDRILVERQPAVVLLGAPLRGGTGRENLEAIRAQSPTSRTIVLAQPQGEIRAVEALRHGARGYCSPATDPAVLCKAIELVQQGELWIGRKAMLELVDEFTRSQPTRPADADFRVLTEREQEVSRLIRSGASNKQIADTLSITEKTVKAHLTNTFRKLGVSSRVQLAVYGLRPELPAPTKVQ